MSTGYSNQAFNPALRGCPREVLNRRLEVPLYHATNETFVDDDGEEFVDMPTERWCRRSIAFPISYHRELERLRAIEDENEEYVDAPGDIVGTRESPVGSAGTLKIVEGRPSSSSCSSPRKPTTPVKVILAPMIAQMERAQTQALARSCSLVRSPRRVLDHGSSPHRTGSLRPLAFSHRSTSVQTSLARSSLSLARPLPPLHPLQPSFSPRRPNTAVIAPNIRGSAMPLLPTKLEETPDSPIKPSRETWPPIHLPTELLCCVGFFLLLSGAASTLLCFYLLSLVGKKYFLYFGAIAGFTALVLGMMSCRTNKWKWLPHRNYLTGYILLSAFSILDAVSLGGIVYAVDTHNYALLDILGGAVCGVSTLLTAGASLGLVTSGCCHQPPPDNRVAHSVDSFRI